MSEERLEGKFIFLVSTPFSLVVKSEVAKIGSFKLVKNQSASSLWVAGHRYTRILCASKLKWV